MVVVGLGLVVWFDQFALGFSVGTCLFWLECYLVANVC